MILTTSNISTFPKISPVAWGRRGGFHPEQDDRLRGFCFSHVGHYWLVLWVTKTIGQGNTIEYRLS